MLSVEVAVEVVVLNHTTHPLLMVILCIPSGFLKLNQVFDSHCD